MLQAVVNVDWLLSNQNVVMWLGLGGGNLRTRFKIIVQGGLSWDNQAARYSFYWFQEIHRTWICQRVFFFKCALMLRYCHLQPPACTLLQRCFCQLDLSLPKYLWTLLTPCCRRLLTIPKHWVSRGHNEEGFSCLIYACDIPKEDLVQPLVKHAWKRERALLHCHWVTNGVQNLGGSLWCILLEQESWLVQLLWKTCVSEAKLF